MQNHLEFDAKIFTYSFFNLIHFFSSKVCDEYSCILCWKTLQKHEGMNRSTLLSVIEFVQDWCLFVNLQGAGTDETTLTRVMVSRGEIDMLDIRAEFKKLYQRSLYKEISVSILHSYKLFRTGSGHLPLFFQICLSPVVHNFLIFRFISWIVPLRYHKLTNDDFTLCSCIWCCGTVWTDCLCDYDGWFSCSLFQSDVSGSYGDCLKMICGGED